MQLLVLAIVLVMLICALAVFMVPGLMDSLIIFSVLSLGLTVLFVLLRAPDVAMTEAAVGAGLGSLMFALVIRRVTPPEQEK